MTVDRLRDALCAVGPPPTTRELEEILWLACHVSAEGRPPPSDTAPESETPEAAITDPAGAADSGAPPGREPNSARDLSLTPGGASRPEPVPPAELHADPAGAPGEKGNGRKPARALLVPTAPMLGDTLGVQRALRPLKRRVPTRRRDVLDEIATAERIAGLPASNRLWVPVLRARRQRWLRLALLVDGSPSMRMWRPLADELAITLTRLGAFRDVRLWTWDEGGVSGQANARLGPRALLDPAGRLLVLALSDCAGPMWWNGTAARHLDVWARRGPVAILQPLAERLWDRTAAAPLPGLASLLRPGAPNTELSFRAYGSDPGRELGGVPVPVLEISRRWLADWAGLVTASRGDVPTAITRVSRMRRTAAVMDPVAREHGLPISERVRRFRVNASPEAVRLAGHFAVSVPVLPVMRLIQHRMVPESGPGHLAEVILSGLLRPVGSGDDSGRYEFVQGAREALLPALSRSEAWRTAEVLEALSDEIEARAGSVGELFRAYLAAPDTAADHGVRVGDRPFALVSPEARSLIDRVSVPLHTGATGQRTADVMHAGPPLVIETLHEVRTLARRAHEDASHRLIQEVAPVGSAGEVPERGAARPRRGSFLDALSAQARSRLMSASVEARYRAQETVLTEGENPERVAILSSGYVRSAVESNRGLTALIDIHGPGDVIGVESILGRSYSTTVTTVDQTGLRVVTSKNFVNSLDISRSSWPVLSLLSARLERIYQRRLARAVLTPHELTASILFDLLERFGGENGFPFRLTNKIMARASGSGLGAMSRYLNDLYEHGAIRYLGSEVRAVDRGALLEFLGEYDRPVSHFIEHGTLQRIRMAGRVVRWERNAVLGIHSRGKEGVGVVLDGYLSAEIGGFPGAGKIVDFYGPGDLIGVESAIDGLREPLETVALGDVQLAVISRQDFLGILNPNSNTISLLRTMTAQLRRQYLWLAGNNRTRLLHVLIDLTDRFGENGSEGTVLPPLTQDELCRLAGVSRETVARALRDLRAQGLISTGHRHLVVHDREALLSTAASSAL